MRFFLTTLIFLSVSTQTFAEACSFKVGDVVEFTHPSEVYDMLSEFSQSKDEFETVDEFQERVRLNLPDQNYLQPILLQGARLDSSKVKYDSEKSEYAVTEYSWNNTSGHWSEALSKSNLYGEDPLYDTYAEVLLKEQKDSDSFVGENAYGARKSVIRRQTTLYGVFDKPKPKRRYKSDGYTPIDAPPMWDLDVTGKYSWDDKLATFNIPRYAAKSIRKSLFAGIYYTPKPPFAGKGYYYRSANYDRPIDESVTMVALVGDIHCVVITDETGKVWKTIATGY